MFNKKIKSRIFFLIFLIFLLVLAVYFSLKTLKENVVYFLSPAEISKKDVEKNPKITGDPTGQTKVTRVSFWFSNGDRASVSCYDYSEELGNNDNLTIGLQTKEQNFFLTHKAYN